MSEHSHVHVDDHENDLQQDLAMRVKALEKLLIDKGLIISESLDLLVDYYQNKVGPQHGAMVVARAWTDPEYLEWLLRDATSAIAFLGYEGRQGEQIVALQNTDCVHNMVVCTLCSCYPWPVLGLPPIWYKSFEYRSRAISEPRKVLEEFGLVLPATVRLKVWDSNSEVRYIVIPMRPEGTDGMTEQELAALVTRNSMIGTGVASLRNAPAKAAISSDKGRRNAGR